MSSSSLYGDLPAQQQEDKRALEQSSPRAKKRVKINNVVQTVEIEARSDPAVASDPFGFDKHLAVAEHENNSTAEEASTEPPVPEAPVAPVDPHIQLKMVLAKLRLFAVRIYFRLLFSLTSCAD